MSRMRRFFPQIHLALFVAAAAFSACSAVETAVPHRIYVGFYASPAPVNLEKASPVYHGVAVSADSGSTWESRGWETGFVSDVLAPDSTGTALFLATDYGILRSVDEGATWMQMNGWRMPPVNCLAAGDSALYAGTADGLYMSTDVGMTWVAHATSLPDDGSRYISGVAVVGETLLASTDNGLWRSSDAGNSWQRIAHPEQPLDGIVTHPRNDSLIAVWHNGSGIWISEDRGATWTWRSEGLRSGRVQSVAFDPFTRNRLMLGTQDFGVFLSEDLGRTWRIAGGGLSNFNITALLFDPLRQGTVYAGAENGMFVSRNGGTQWEHSGIRLGYITAIRGF